MKKHSILTLISAVMLGFGATSCDDYLDVNKNIDAPDYVDGYLYLAGIQSGYSEVYYDLRAAMPLTQMTASGYSNFAAHYYTSASDAAGQIWRMVYWTQGMNLENLINQSVAAGDWHLAGIGLVMKAYSWDMLTKYHGELPMKDAYVPGLLAHDYDYQQDIYPQIREWAEQGIKYLEMEDEPYGTKISNNDLIYGADIDKWIKFGHAVIVRNLASLTNKNDFKEKYYDKMMDHFAKAFASNDDNATVRVDGGGAESLGSSYNNFFGVYRGNITYTYVQSEWPVAIMTGSVPHYNEAGQKTEEPHKYKYKLAEKQIITDTLVNEPGHWDPRVVAKLGTTDGNHVANFAEIDSIKAFNYYGGKFGGKTGSIGTAPSFFGRTESATDAKDGAGRWLYHNDVPYILCTYGEILFDVAEAQFKYGSKSEAYETWKKAVAADMEFTAKYLVAGNVVEVSKKQYHQGDKITKAQFDTAAAEYLAGPYVGALSMDEFSLSHIMMQKYVHLFPWGAMEAWVDQRKYHYDIAYNGEYPSYGNGWDKSTVQQKKDNDDTKVFKGFYLAPAEVDGRKSSYNEKNNGSPCYRVRPRYNSEYMWNKPSLEQLKPISGMADDYQCSIPWFAYPGTQPGAPEETVAE